MNEMVSKLINHLIEHPVRLAATNAAVVGAAHFAPTTPVLEPIETSAKIILVLLTCAVTGITGWQKLRGKGGGRHPLKPIRLLMVDDDVDDCALFSRSFRRHHCEVTAVQSHAAALAELRSDRRYDLVLLDARIPGSDPATLFRQIKLERPRQSVAVFSGVIDPGLIESVSKWGFALFMRKPTTGVAEFVEELVSSLRVRS
jgi:CheY-like chemotaxis protein